MYMCVYMYIYIAIDSVRGRALGGACRGASERSRHHSYTNHYYTCIHVYTCTYMYIYIYIYVISISIHVCIYIYIYIQIYIYIYISPWSEREISAALHTTSCSGRRRFRGHNNSISYF